MLPMMLPRWDFMMARGRALEANVSIAMVKTFPEARCRRLPLRTAMAKVPASRPTVPPRMCRIKSRSRMLPRPLSTCDCYHGPEEVTARLLSKRLPSICRERLSRSDISSRDTLYVCARLLTFHRSRAISKGRKFGSRISTDKRLVLTELDQFPDCQQTGSYPRGNWLPIHVNWRNIAWLPRNSTHAERLVTQPWVRWGQVRSPVVWLAV